MAAKGTESSLKVELELRQCRICLQNEQECKNQMLASCKCQGSIEYVHRNCMEKWIQTSLSKKTVITAAKQLIQCEMCKQSIYYEVQRTIKLNNCQEFARKIWQNKYLNLILLLGAIFIIISIGVVIWFLVGFQISFNGESIFPVIMIIVLSTFVVTLCFVIPITIFAIYLTHFEYKCSLSNTQIKKPQPQRQILIKN